MTSEIQNLTSMFGNNTETFVVTKLFEILSNSVNCKDGYLGMLKNIAIGIFQAFGIIYIRKIAQDNSSLSSLIKNLCIQAFYRKIKVKNTETVYQTFKTLVHPGNDMEHSVTINVLPIYSNIEAGTMTISYFNLLHRNFITSIYDEFNHKLEEIKNTHNTKCLDHNRTQFTPSNMYPTKNLKSLRNRCVRFFHVAEKISSIRSVSFLIDGEPGLGKSASYEYLGYNNVSQNLFYVDMSLRENIAKSFDDVLKALNMKCVKGTTIIFFDEIDKYLSSRIEVEFHAQKEYTDINVYKRVSKNSFLMTLRDLIKCNNQYSTIYIFYSNNFHTIFEDTDTVHFNSLGDLFTIIPFQRCDKTELVEFINYINVSMEGLNEKLDMWRYDAALDNQCYYDPLVLNEKLCSIPDDISIKFRDVIKYYARSEYDTMSLIDMLCNHIEVRSPALQSSPREYMVPSPTFARDTCSSKVSGPLIELPKPSAPVPAPVPVPDKYVLSKTEAVKTAPHCCEAIRKCIDNNWSMDNNLDNSTKLLNVKLYDKSYCETCARMIIDNNGYNPDFDVIKFDGTDGTEKKVIELLHDKPHLLSLLLTKGLKASSIDGLMFNRELLRKIAKNNETFTIIVNNLEKITDYHMPLLIACAEVRNLEGLKLMVSKGLSVTDVMDYSGIKLGALYQMCEHMNGREQDKENIINVTTFLLDSGCNPILSLGCQSDPLCKSFRVNIDVFLLMAKRTDFSKYPEAKQVRLLKKIHDHEKIHQKYDIVKTMIDNGLNINTKWEGKTVLHMIATDNTNLDISYLTTLGADLSITDSKGNIPADLAKSKDAHIFK